MSEPIVPPTLENLQVIPPAEKDAFNLKKDLRARMVELKGVIVQEEKEYKSLSLEIQTLLTSPPSPPTLQTTLSSYLDSNPHLRDSHKRRRHSDSASMSEADAQGEDTDDFDGMGDETMDGVEEEARTQAEGDGVADYLLDVPDEDEDADDEAAAAVQTNGNGVESTEGLVDPVKVVDKRDVISLGSSSDEEHDAPPPSTLLPPPPSNGTTPGESSSSAQPSQPEELASPSKPSSNSLTHPPVSIVTPASPPPPPTQLAQQSSSTEEAFAASQGSNQSIVPATPSPPPEAESSLDTSALAGPSRSTPFKAESSRLLSPSASNATFLSPPSAANPVELAPTRGSGSKSAGHPKDRDHSPSSSSGFSSDLGDEEEENERERRLSEVGLVEAPTGVKPPSSTKSNSNSRTRGAVAAASDSHAPTSPSASTSSALPPTSTNRPVRKKSFSTSFDPKTKRRSSVSPLPSSRHDLGLPSHRTLSHGHMSRPEDLFDDPDDAQNGELADYDGPLPSDVWQLKDSKDRRAIKERKARQEIARAKRIEEIREEARKTVEKADADGEGEVEEEDAEGEMDVDGEELDGGVKLEEMDESVVGGEVEGAEDAVASSSKKSSVKDKGKGKEVLKRDATEDVSMDGEGEDEEATEEPEEVVIPPEQRKGRSRSSAVAAVADPTPVKSNKGKGHPKGKMPPRTIAALVAASEPSVKDSTPTASDDGDLDADGSFIETASQISRNSAAPPSVSNSTGGTSERRNKNGTKQKTTKQRQDEKAAGLSELEAAELHEKRKLDRRIRDRARRERDKASVKAEEDARAVEAEAEAEGENEDGTPAKRSNKKRKATQGKNKSPAPDHDRATKKRREEMSATPEGGVRSSSRHASSSRQPSSSRAPANSRGPSLPPLPPSPPPLLLPPAPNPQLPPKNFKKAIDLLFQGISQHRSSSLFQIPIKDADAPGYSETVLRPMDLRTIKSRIKDGAIGNVDEFERDMLLMFANAMLYNERETEVHRMAEEMMGEAEKQIREWRHLQWRLLHGSGSNGD
ncbi:hypothetical protein BDY24DRAFT_388892 [Mrakia frigida]|uniref:uncharacterized protein n=1 Tax=Mrakia frigida TaxID=29902 RepID=UPI003FCC143A